MNAYLNNNINVLLNLIPNTCHINATVFSCITNIFFSEDGIVIAISVWQCLLEFFTNYLLAGIFHFLDKGQSYLVNILSLISVYFLNYIIFPSFYLLADARFRRVLIQKGTFRAIWLALKQEYDQ